MTRSAYKGGWSVVPGSLRSWIGAQWNAIVEYVELEMGGNSPQKKGRWVRDLTSSLHTTRDCPIYADTLLLLYNGSSWVVAVDVLLDLDVQVDSSSLEWLPANNSIEHSPLVIIFPYADIHSMKIRATHQNHTQSLSMRVSSQCCDMVVPCSDQETFKWSFTSDLLWWVVAGPSKQYLT